MEDFAQKGFTPKDEELLLGFDKKGPDSFLVHMLGQDGPNTTRIIIETLGLAEAEKVIFENWLNRNEPQIEKSLEESSLQTHFTLEDCKKLLIGVLKEIRANRDKIFATLNTL